VCGSIACPSAACEGAGQQCRRAHKRHQHRGPHATRLPGQLPGALAAERTTIGGLLLALGGGGGTHACHSFVEHAHELISIRPVCVCAVLVDGMCGGEIVAGGQSGKTASYWACQAGAPACCTCKQTNAMGPFFVVQQLHRQGLLGRQAGAAPAAKAGVGPSNGGSGSAGLASPPGMASHTDMHTDTNTKGGESSSGSCSLVVNISSVMASHGDPTFSSKLGGRYAYRCSKAALNAINKGQWVTWCRPVLEHGHVCVRDGKGVNHHCYLAFASQGALPWLASQSLFTSSVSSQLRWLPDVWK
jgi:hypothetical protein